MLSMKKITNSELTINSVMKTIRKEHGYSRRHAYRLAAAIFEELAKEQEEAAKESAELEQERRGLKVPIS